MHHLWPWQPLWTSLFSVMTLHVTSPEFRIHSIAAWLCAHRNPNTAMMKSVTMAMDSDLASVWTLHSPHIISADLLLYAVYKQNSSRKSTDYMMCLITLIKLYNESPEVARLIKLYSTLTPNLSVPCNNTMKLMSKSTG